MQHTVRDKAMTLSEKSHDLTPAEQQAAGFSRQFAMAMELPFVIVSAIAVGGLIGFFLDRWLHTEPYMMLALGSLQRINRVLSRSGRGEVRGRKILRSRRADKGNAR
jgi:F0F1-type ATP synthase assembly protein I